MYAVIRTGGKQYKVESGQQLAVEKLSVDGAAATEGAELELAPLMLVDGDTVLATPSQLGKATVKVRVVGDTKGKKIRIYHYHPKHNWSRRAGHRSHQTLIEIDKIAV